MVITLADRNCVQELANLFNKYRIFYGEETNLKEVEKFLESRFKNDDSVLIIARDKTKMSGFIQLYPSFSSVGMQRIWILNDLYVDVEFRRKKVASNLLKEAEKFAQKTGALRLELATQTTNTAAQNLYESLGYIKNKDFFHYSFPIKSASSN
ncbi:MAG: GNAT family N-acetyltransferase [Nitrospinota bacterium]